MAPWGRGRTGPPVVDSGAYRAELRAGELWLLGQTKGASGQKPAVLQLSTLDPVGLGE